MRRKVSTFAVAALSGALGFSAAPLWSDGNPKHAQNRDQASMRQDPDQTNIAGNWNRAETEMNSQNVKELQQALKEQGHDPGPLDGIVGPQTQAALKSFQQSRGLEPTGQLDDQTMAQLGMSQQSSERSSAQSDASSAETGQSSFSSETSSTDSAETSSSS